MYAFLGVIIIFSTHALAVIYKKKQLFYLWTTAIAMITLLLFGLIGKGLCIG
jgi:hypothetical protein